MHAPAKQLLDLYDQYSPAVYGEITRVTNSREEADEIFVDVFTTICKKFDEYDPSRGRLFTWIISITRMKCIERLKQINITDNTATSIHTHSCHLHDTPCRAL